MIIPILQGFVYVSTIVATLRAGSRLTFMMRHNGRIGEMDGPRILGPSDLNTEKIDAKSINISLEEGVVQTASVSPLWTISYVFEKAVQFSSASAAGEDKRRRLLLHNPIFFSLEDIIPLNGPWTTPKIQPDAYENKYPLSTFGVAKRVRQNNTIDFLLEQEQVNSNCNERERLQGDNSSSTLLTQNNVTEIFPLDSKSEAISLFKKLRLPSLPHPISIIQGTFEFTVKKPLAYSYHSYQNTKTWTIDKIHDMYFSYFYANWRRTPIQVSPTSTIRRGVDSKVDFTSCDTVGVIIPSANPKTDSNSTKHIAQVTTYAPKAFARLRSKFGIDETDFCKIMQTPLVSFQSNSKGAARAGLFFFFTRNGAYMIKSIKRSEAKTLLKLLPKYYKYMSNHVRAKRSLLTRICGLYEMSLIEYDEPAKSDGGTSIRPGGRIRNDEGHHILLVMNSVFPAEASQFLSERFDLKGSTVGRFCTEEEQRLKGSNAVLKDLNLANEHSTGLNIGTRRKAALLSQLRQDVQLLVECGVMDYSLLVGVVNMERDYDGILPKFPSTHFHRLIRRIRRKQHELNSISDSDGRRPFSKIMALLSIPIRAVLAPPLFLLSKIHTLSEVTLSTILTLPLPYYGAGICGVDGGTLSVIHGTRKKHRAVYYFGLIDFLQPWSTRKFIEREIKGLLGYDKKAVSAVTPSEYGNRFISFLDSHIT